jgi:hypothetical protein
MDVLHASATVIALHVQALQQGTDAAEVIVVRGDAPEIEELMLVTEGEGQVTAEGLAEGIAVSEGNCLHLKLFSSVCVVGVVLLSAAECCLRMWWCSCV